jgi:hypothetical protein
MNENIVTWSGTSSHFFADVGMSEAILGREMLQKLEAASPITEKKVTDIEKELEIDEGDSSAAVAVFEDEERAVGAVQFRVFEFYAKCTGGIIQMLAVLATTILLLASKIIGLYWFVWWIDNTLGFSKEQYVWGYLGLTVSQALVTCKSPIKAKVSLS